MKVTVIGVKRMKGIGKESGNAYDFASCEVLAPIQNRTSEKFSIQGLGFEVAKLDMDLTALASFNDVKFPATLELTVEHRPDRNGMKPVVTGCVAVPANVKAVA